MKHVPNSKMAADGKIVNAEDGGRWENSKSSFEQVSSKVTSGEHENLTKWWSDFSWLLTYERKPKYSYVLNDGTKVSFERSYSEVSMLSIRAQAYQFATWAQLLGLSACVRWKVIYVYKNNTTYLRVAPDVFEICVNGEIVMRISEKETVLKTFFPVRQTSQGEFLFFFAGFLATVHQNHVTLTDANHNRIRITRSIMFLHVNFANKPEVFLYSNHVKFCLNDNKLIVLETAKVVVFNRLICYEFTMQYLKFGDVKIERSGSLYKYFKKLELSVIVDNKSEAHFGSQPEIVSLDGDFIAALINSDDYKIEIRGTGYIVTKEAGFYIFYTSAENMNGFFNIVHPQQPQD